MGALAAGVPLLIIPALAASQTRNAQAVAACGSGRMLDRGQLSREIVQRDVRLLLDDPAYATVAGKISEEIANMPSPHAVVPVLEELAAHGRRP
jgi:UDP:flavonoid glycosyltransferase YjiC (YdhE family)